MHGQPHIRFLDISLACHNFTPDFVNKKWTAVPLQAWTEPRRFKEVKAPLFHDNRHMKVLRLSAATHRPPLPPGIYTSFVARRYALQCISLGEQTSGWKKPNDFSVFRAVTSRRLVQTVTDIPNETQWRHLQDKAIPQHLYCQVAECCNIVWVCRLLKCRAVRKQ